MVSIPIFGMLGVSQEITPFWYEIHTFVLNRIGLQELDSDCTTRPDLRISSSLLQSQG